MAVTQYIGARYVPMFYTNPDDGTNNWHSGVVYDPLTIVTDINQSYTSKIPVPATVGRPSENPTYWILTGAYNAQVEQYRQEVLDYKDETMALVNTYRGEVSDLAAEYDKLNFYHDRKILIIGDSLSDTELEEYQPNWVTFFKTRAEDLGATVVNHSVSGRTYSAVRGVNLVGSLDSVPDPSTYTDIIIFLGVNDWVSDATIQQMASASNYFEEWHNNNNPGATIHLITPCRCATTWNPDFPLSYIRCAMINYGAKHFRWQLIDAYSEAPNMDGMRSELAARWTTDGLHFRPSYAPHFAEYIFNRIAAGTSSALTIGAEAISIASGISNVDMNLLYYDSGMIRLYMELPEDYTPATQTVSIGTLPIFARPYRTVTHAFYYASGGVSKMGLIRLDPNGTIYMIAQDVHAMRLGYINIEYMSQPVYGNVD